MEALQEMEKLHKLMRVLDMWFLKAGFIDIKQSVFVRWQGKATLFIYHFSYTRQTQSASVHIEIIKYN